MTLREALQHIMRSCPNPQAKQYAEAGIAILDGKYAGDPRFLGYTTQYLIKKQIPYILLNVTHWRGDLAKQVKMYLRSL